MVDGMEDGARHHHDHGKCHGEKGVVKISQHGELSRHASELTAAAATTAMADTNKRRIP